MDHAEKKYHALITDKVEDSYKCVRQLSFKSMAVT
ncbi:hypothetical protein ABIC22_000472 [Paenibacillus sp. PvP094]